MFDGRRDGTDLGQAELPERVPHAREHVQTRHVERLRARGRRNRVSDGANDTIFDHHVADKGITAHRMDRAPFEHQNLTAGTADDQQGSENRKAESFDRHQWFSRQVYAGSLPTDRGMLRPRRLGVIVRNLVVALRLVFDRCQLRLDRFDVRLTRPIGTDVEVQIAVDEGLAHHGKHRQRRPVVEHEIGVFADLDRAHAVVDAELDGGIQGHRRERRNFVHAAPLDGLGRLLVEMTHLFGTVGIDRHDDATLGHQRGSMRNRVVGFDFVAPPIREGRGAGTVGSDLVGDLVAFEHVLEGGDLEAELFGQAQQLENLVGPVAMRVHQPLAVQDLDQPLQLEVTPWGHRRLAACRRSLESRPFRAVGLGRR